MSTTRTSDLDAVHTIVRVERATVSGLAPDGTWPCPTCTDEYGVHECWKVTYVAGGPHAQVVIVCGHCAERARTRRSSSVSG